MDERKLVKPDLKFAREVIGLGGESLKKCYQCSTCTIMCPIAPDDSPFPRKEMIWAQWGLKDKLRGDPDIWLCQRCTDCSIHCPRDAKPGEVMAALRGWVIAEHAVPRFLGKAFASARYLPLVAVIPILLVVAYLALWGDLHYPNTFNSGDEIILDHFIRDSHGDYGVFIMFGFMFGVLGLGILKFWKGLNASAIVPATRSGLSIIQSLIRAVIETLKHANFTRCETSRSAYWAHLGIMYGCIALIGATGITFVLHYGMGWHSPWGIFSVTKVLGTIGTVLVMAGTGIALYKRLANDPTSGKSSYLDWFLLLLLILVTLSGFATWMLRIAELEAATYWAYLVHIVLFFEFFIYLPFSKAAHIFYRLTAMTWSHYTGRGL